MEELIRLEKAKEVYHTLCEALDENKWPYEKHEDDFLITCGARGEDLPINIIILVDKEREIVTLQSPLPIIIPQDRYNAFAMASCIVNRSLMDGCFYFNYLSGDLHFRMSFNYLDSEIGKGAFNYMLFFACLAIDKYNDKFLKLSEQKMSLKEIKALLS